MMINFVELENIRSYEKAKVSFPEGSVLLWGDIGSGKSTLLYSIDYALFGSSNVDVRGLIRKGKRYGKIKVGFEIENKKIIVERTITLIGDKIKNDSCYITINGLREEVTPTMLKTRIFSLLGYPLSLKSLKKTIPFRYTVYVPQERMKEILISNDTERMLILRGLFDIEKYKVLIDNLSLFRKYIRDRIASLEAKEEIIKKELDKEDEIVKRKNHVEENIKLLDEKLKRVKEKVDEYNSFEDKKGMIEHEIEVITQKKEHLHNKISDIKNTLSIIESSLRSLYRLSSYSLEYESAIFKGGDSDLDTILEKIEHYLKEVSENISLVDKELNLLEEKYSSLRETLDKKRLLEKDIALLMQDKRKSEEIIEDLLKENEDLKKKIIKIEIKENYKEYYEKRIKEVENNINKKNELLMHVSSQISKLKGLIEERGSEIEKISTLDICPYCKQKVSDQHKKSIKEEYIIYKEKIDKEIKDLVNSKQYLMEEITKLKEDLDSLRKQYEKEMEKDKIKEMNKVYEEKIMLNNDQVNKLKQKINELDKKIEEKKHQLSDMKDIEKEFDDVVRKREEFIKKINELNVRKKDLEKEKGLFIRIKEKYEEYLNIKDKNNREIEKILTQIRDLDQEIKSKTEEANKIKEALISLEKYVSEYEVLLKEKSNQEGILSELKKQYDTLQYMKGDLENLTRERSAFEELNSFILEVMIPYIEKLEKTVIFSLRREFEQVFKYWISVLLPNADFQVSIDDTFYPLVHLNGYEMSYDHLSGGEKQSIALAYRLTLNKIINDFIGNVKTKDLLILDEPTDGFSQEQMESIRDVLNNLNLKQLIIVSHEEVVKDFVDNIIKIEKIGGKSVVESNF